MSFFQERVGTRTFESGIGRDPATAAGGATVEGRRRLPGPDRGAGTRCGHAGRIPHGPLVSVRVRGLRLRPVANWWRRRRPASWTGSARRPSHRECPRRGPRASRPRACRPSFAGRRGRKRPTNSAANRRWASTGGTSSPFSSSWACPPSSKNAAPDTGRTSTCRRPWCRCGRRSSAGGRIR